MIGPLYIYSVAAAMGFFHSGGQPFQSRGNNDECTQWSQIVALLLLDLIRALLRSFNFGVFSYSVFIISFEWKVLY